MEDRILINDAWYIEKIDFIGFQYETENYSWEAIRLLDDDRKTLYDDFYVKFIDKSLKNKKPEVWDLDEWIEDFYNNDPVAITCAKENMNEDALLHFKEFLKELEERGWFKKNI
jgi:hypothetical protein